MAKPDAILSFEDISVPLSEQKLRDIAKILLASQGTEKGLLVPERFHELFSPLMTVAEAIKAYVAPDLWVESSYNVTPRYLPEPEQAALYVSTSIFDQQVLTDSGVVTCRPLAFGDVMNVFALLTLSEDQFADTIKSARITKVYTETEAISVDCLVQSKFIDSPHNRELYVSLQVPDKASISGALNRETGTFRVNTSALPDGVDLIGFDLKIEMRHLTQR